MGYNLYVWFVGFVLVILNGIFNNYICSLNTNALILSCTGLSLMLIAGLNK